MPDGVGISLGVKDYKNAKTLDRVLIGEREEEGRVFPFAHAYDGSYTRVRVEWLDTVFWVTASGAGSELAVLVEPEGTAKKSPSLIVYGVSLWNRGGAVAREGERLILSGQTGPIPVFLTAPDNGERFTGSRTPYLSADMDGPVGISAGRRMDMAEIRRIIDAGRANWEANRAQYGALAEAYNAMQTAQAWDTVYNPQSDAPITTVSRIWNKNWGGYVLFCWDTYFAALMQSLDNRALAYCNLSRSPAPPRRRVLCPTTPAKTALKASTGLSRRWGPWWRWSFTKNTGPVVFGGSLPVFA
jgi:hypothetical protein